MNLRTLKKLSKRAAKLLPLLGDEREQFPAERGASYHSAFIGDRKHWERDRVRSDYVPYKGLWSIKRGDEILTQTRSGGAVVLRPPTHPLKGTIMVGWMSQGEEPEWNEQDAWSVLEDHVCAHFADWDGHTTTMRRTFDSPKELVSGAWQMVFDIHMRERQKAIWAVRDGIFTSSLNIFQRANYTLIPSRILRAYTPYLSKEMARPYKGCY